MIFAIRPEPGLQATLQAARELGLAIIGRPLFEVVPLRWTAPDAEDFDALLVGSANAFRHGGGALESLSGLPVHAVGEATALAAREAGFMVGRTGQGGLQALIDRAKKTTRFLRLAGSEHVALDVPADMTVTTRILYEVRALPLTGSDEVSLRASEPLVLLHSAAAARHFASECERRELDKTRIALACIGPRVADAAGDGWRACEAAPQPNDTALLALARDMCH
ncbi:uroporphyrinogen-III synthase [Aurantiacibacter aquimixticola]|uniref:Uroporphyrinogen-III synthase n=1 Tax=Aurantiacibacter aquimixticola TaxID=1958945 RepID=A0A419RQA0_9SPHN|nr:uroporphyrinogen-III synthase [Aurantiacibacter aquimixticola]RJY07959.1 uroporphyrinogen-III synthase [Aurantiacibacter aquimixticola]